MIKKAVIPVAGLGTRFLPLSKVVSKELWPLVDKPLIYYAVKEAKEAGAEEIIFVFSPSNKKTLDYFKPSPKIEKALKEKKRESLLEDLKEIDQLVDGLSFSYVIERKPLGDGHAILQAAKEIGDEPFFSLYVDDVIDSNIPALAQLGKVYKTSEKPVIALFRKKEEELSRYGVVEVEKIANRHFKIKKIIEKPKKEEVPSDLAILGRYILTPDIFDYLKRAKPGKNGEIILAEVLENFMLKAGKPIYGYEIEGNWLECGEKLKWMESNFYLSLKNKKYGKDLKDKLKNI